MRAGNRLTLTNARYAIGRQLGAGVYTSPRLGDWAGNAGDWFCAVTADARAFERAAKAWIPASEWWLPKRIDRYIGALDNARLNPATTLRFSAIEGAAGGEALQMVIPKKLLSRVRHGGLGIRVACAETMENAGSAAASYDAWDIRGVPQGPSAPGGSAPAGGVEGDGVAAGARGSGISLFPPAASVEADRFGDTNLVSSLERDGAPEGLFLVEDMGATAQEGVTLESSAFMQTLVAREAMLAEEVMAEPAAGEAVMGPALARVLAFVAEDTLAMPAVDTTSIAHC